MGGGLMGLRASDGMHYLTLVQALGSVRGKKETMNEQHYSTPRTDFFLVADPAFAGALAPGGKALARFQVSHAQAGSQILARLLRVATTTE